MSSDRWCLTEGLSESVVCGGPVRLGYILLAVPITSSALALGYWLVQAWGTIGLLPCIGETECGGSPPILSWPFVLLLILGLALFKKGILPRVHGADTPTRTAPDGT
jgi:hypothetical protein